MTGAASDDRQVRSLAKGASLNVLGNATKALLGGVLLWLISRGLGAADAGAFIEATGVFLILTSVGLLGVNVGLVRAVSRGMATGQTSDGLRRVLPVALVPVVVMSTVLAVAMWAWADVVAEAIGNGDHVADIAAHLRGLAPFLPFSSLAMALLGATRGFEDMAPTVFLDRAMKLAVQCLGVAAVVLLGWPTLSLAWGLPVVGVSAGAAVWLRRIWRRRLTDSTAATPPAAASDDAVPLGHLIRDFWSFTLPRAASNVFQIVVQWFDVLLVGGLLTTRDAGIYAVSTRLISFGLAAAEALGTVSQPMFGRLHATGERSRLRELFETTTAWQVLISWPQYMFVLLAAPVVLSLFGPAYPDGAAVVVVLAVAAIVANGVGPVDMVLLMAGKSTWTMVNTALALTVNVVLNLVLLPRYGIVGAAIAWGASRVINNALPLWQSWRYLDVHPFGPKWWRAALLSAGTFGGGGLIAFLTTRLDTASEVVTYFVLASGAYVLLVVHDRALLDIDHILAGVRRRRARSAGSGSAGTAAVQHPGDGASVPSPSTGPQQAWTTPHVPAGGAPVNTVSGGDPA